MLEQVARPRFKQGWQFKLDYDHEFVDRLGTLNRDCSRTSCFSYSVNCPLSKWLGFAVPVLICWRCKKSTVFRSRHHEVVTRQQAVWDQKYQQLAKQLKLPAALTAQLAAAAAAASASTEEGSRSALGGNASWLGFFFFCSAYIIFLLVNLFFIYII